MCRMKSKTDRLDYLERIKEKRGLAAMVELRNEVKRQWAERTKN